MQKPAKRPFNKIEYSSEIRKSNVNTKRGTQQETNSLNINLKTINKGFLLEHMADHHEPTKAKIINEYIHEKANFTSTRKLFGFSEEAPPNKAPHEEIKEHMARVYEDADFVKKIMNNEKMDLKTKLLIIKFLERIRMSALNPSEHKLWKVKF